MEFIKEIFHHTIEDTIKMLPFLFAAYLIIEYIEHKAKGKLEKFLHRFGRFGAIGGSVLGIFPQCGFSVMASNFFAGKIITAGTLVAVFISTSDEAIPFLMANPEKAGVILPVIVLKVLIALLTGLMMDFFGGKVLNIKSSHHHHIEELCSHDGCNCHKGSGIFKSAIHHTVNIFVFIFVFSLVINGAVELIGEENLGKVLMNGSFLQPVLAAIVGFIPNCAVSVLLAELYVSGSLSLGSLIAGLCTGAGAGLVVLFKVNKNIKENLKILGYISVSAVLSGIIIQGLGF
ncbi:MAG: arsenic efflux protein [Clostridia bacterium]|nr:arsenic efflux protein [Clostridia bacterium]